MTRASAPQSLPGPVNVLECIGTVGLALESPWWQMDVCVVNDRHANIQRSWLNRNVLS